MINHTLNADLGDDVSSSGSAATTRARQGMIPASRQDGPLGGASRVAIVQALDMVSEAVFFLDADLRIADANAAAARSSGYHRGELRGMRLEDVISDNGDGGLRTSLDRLLGGEGVAGTLPARQRRKDGGSLAARVQLDFIDLGKESMLVAVVQDAAYGELDEQVSRDASRDFLTALPARGALQSRLRRAERRARRRDSRFAVLFIDVDGFKGVNDTMGHRTGDLVLRVLGRRLAASVRPGDFVARYGGDEFVALIEDVRTDAEVQQIAARIHAQLSEPIRAGDGRLQVSVSVGVAIGHAAADALVDEADRAMYRMKQAKRANCLDTKVR
ncbi:MAG: GGDEF domain-containing protein [Planctomycetaceae bacterium]